MPIWHGIPRRLWQSPVVGHISSRLPRALQARLRKSINRNVRGQDVDRTEVIRVLQSIQRQQVDQLSEILNRGFPEWTTLNSHP
jgi:hypothetical protein